MKKIINTSVMVADTNPIKIKNHATYTVESILVGYPIAPSGTITEIKIGKAKYTASELLTIIRESVAEEINKGHNYAPHDINDYVIEQVIVENGVADVYIGS